jgi:cytidylate kinase
MSECGKSTVGKYLDSCGILRLKIVRLFERVRDKWSPQSELYQFTGEEERRNPYALCDAFLDELLAEMETRKASIASIESLYGGFLGPYLKHRMGNRFHIVYIDIPLEVRLQRQMRREGLATVEEAKRILLPRDEVKADSGIPALKDIADEVIDNSGTMEDLYRAIDELIARCK